MACKFATCTNGWNESESTKRALTKFMQMMILWITNQWVPISQLTPKSIYSIPLPSNIRLAPVFRTRVGFHYWKYLKYSFQIEKNYNACHVAKNMMTVAFSSPLNYSSINMQKRNIYLFGNVFILVCSGLILHPRTRNSMSFSYCKLYWDGGAGVEGYNMEYILWITYMYASNWICSTKNCINKIQRMSI